MKVLRNLQSVLGQKLRAQQDRFCTVIYGNLTKRDNGFDVELASGCIYPHCSYSRWRRLLLDTIGGHAVGLVAESQRERPWHARDVASSGQLGRDGSSSSARACEQLLKRLLHAFGILGRVR